MKRFLLLAGQDAQNPGIADEDWIDFFDTREEADAEVIKDVYDIYHQHGSDKGKVAFTGYKLTIRGNRHYHWYEIIDLETWEPKL